MFSEINLLSCDLDSTGSHQLLFNSKQDLSNYFKSRKEKTFKTRHIRGENYSLLVDGNYLEMCKYNYMYYDENFPNSPNKTIYCFIDSIEYVNEVSSKITYHVDTLTTYYYDYEVEQSYIVREHFKQDDYSTVIDNIDTGELVVTDSKVFDFDGAYFVFLSNDVTRDEASEINTCKIGDYTVPCQVVYFPASKNGSNKLGEFLQNVSNKGRGDRIISCFYTPLMSTPDFELKQVSGDVGSFTVINSISAESLRSVVSCSFENLIVTKFKKMCVAPYSYIRVQDTITGQYILLDYGKFETRSLEFEIRTDISETPSIRVIPKNYNGEYRSYSNSLVINCQTSLPVCNNLYASYLMKNQEINDLNKTFGVVGAMQQIASNPLNPLTYANAGIGAYEKISMINAGDRQQHKQASQITGFSDGACQRLNFENSIRIELLMPDKYHREQIEKYWNMYGYPVHEYDKPNFRINNRNNCYVKLIEPNIIFKGVPVVHQNTIVEQFERGVTFWKDKDSFRRYYWNDEN